MMTRDAPQNPLDKIDPGLRQRKKLRPDEVAGDGQPKSRRACARNKNFRVAPFFAFSAACCQRSERVLALPRAPRKFRRHFQLN